MSSKMPSICADCGAEKTRTSKITALPGITRRDFLGKLGKAAAVAGAAPLITPLEPVFARGPQEPAELAVKELLATLSSVQRVRVLLPWGDPRRLQAHNNWRVIPDRISQVYTRAQQELIREILRGVTSEEGFDKIQHAMRDDAGGLGNYSAALFSDDDEQLCFLLTGRHQTIRADGGAEKNAVLGGPLFYGHAVEFYERPDHPGNVWWHQSRLASKVYHALDGKQQEQALILGGSPADQPSAVELKGEDGKFTGIAARDLSPDQRELVEQTLRSLLEPYRESDVQEVMTAIKANGGLDKLHLTFYKDGDLPDKEGIWDRWKLEGPTFAWYFRGTPHVHTWINVAHRIEDRMM